MISISDAALYQQAVLSSRFGERLDFTKFKVNVARQMREHLPLRRFNVFRGQTDVSLTYRQAQCVVLLLRGYTLRAAGEFLGISPRTVEAYLNAVKSQVDVKRKHTLIAFFMSTDFIQLNKALFVKMGFDHE